jgi:photosystem II stability/assembly factor-like uncharacterized protein
MKISKAGNLLITLIIMVAVQLKISAQSYTWNTVPVKGGGFVSGLIYNKAETDLLYARTDVGGAYRWDAASKKWIPITDGMTNPDDMGIWSLAPDPSDPDKVYIATGLYSASWGSYGAVYGSSDKGNTWTKLSTLPFRLGANDPGRGICERMVVDPNKSNIIFLGSKQDGLYKSTNSGVTWTKVTSLPGSYITFVVFDRSAGTSGTATPVIYAGVADYIYNGGNVGIYKSTDGGSTWSKMQGHPTKLTPKSFAPGDAALTCVPVSMAISSGNNIYITFCNSVTPNGDYQLAAPHNTVSNGAVYKFNKNTGTWTDITPANSANLQGGFSTVDVSAKNPDRIVISTTERWWPADELYFSSDAGANWASTFNSFSYASTWGNSLNKGAFSTAKAPYASTVKPHWTTSVVINPARDNEVMIGAGIGIFANYDVSGLFSNANANNTASTTWIFENDGLEETVPLDLVSPPAGAPLVSVIGDFDGFVHSDLKVSPATGRHVTSGKLVGSTFSLAFAELAPAKMVKTHSNNDYIKGSYSNDGGLTWSFFATQPAGVAANTTGGQIAISADGKKIVWAPETGAIAYSTDNGATWKNSTGNVPNGLKPVADRANSSRFYLIDPANQKVYTTSDAGVSFSAVSLNLPGIPSYMQRQPMLSAVPGREGHVWLADRDNGLYRSTNYGAGFTKTSSVTAAYKITTGKAADNSTYPALFLWGIVNGTEGLFQSDDEGNTWTRMNDSNHEFGRAYSCMTGDPRVYGRVYIGLGGRGIVYSEKSVITETTPATEASAAVSVFPNPFRQQIQISCEGGFSYSIYTTDGVLIETGNGSNAVCTGEELKSGIYLVRIKQGDKVSVHRIAKGNF